MSSRLKADIVTNGVRIHHHPRSRRMKLRVDPVTGDVVLTLPRGVGRTEGLRFMEQQSDWIRARQAALTPAVPFTPGTRLPFRGMLHRIEHVPDHPGIWRDPDGPRICCGIPLHNFEGRLKDWFIAQARTHLGARVACYAAQIGRTVARVRIGDPKTRWGSCSTSGTLSLSWRLIMAPDPVSDYVVAHEVAHIMEMNHSPRFWRVVETLVGDSDEARAWLKKEGAALHRIGVNPLYRPFDQVGPAFP